MEIARDETGQAASIVLEAAVDAHVHARQAPDTPYIVPDTARQFEWAFNMPNTNPPIITMAQARRYHDYVGSCVPTQINFSLKVALYLDVTTSEADIDEAAESGIIFAVKYYPSHGTTQAGAGIRCFYDARHILDRMQRHKLPLALHGEVIRDEEGNLVDIFDRERRFLPVFERLIQDHPELPCIFEHVSTVEGVQFVEAAPGHIMATVTPQHILENRTTGLFTRDDGHRTPSLQPLGWCLPILKREGDRQAVLRFAVESSKAMLGTDNAPHGHGAKTNFNGCSAGCTTNRVAMELYTQAFESIGGLASLEDFASRRARKFYGLPPATRHIRLIRRNQMIPSALPYGNEQVIHPFWAGREIPWMFTPA